MIKITISILFIYIFSGCTKIDFFNLKKSTEKIQKFSCEEETEPKSLQFLEQQYRCTTK